MQRENRVTKFRGRWGRWRRKELADYWGISDRTFDRMVSDGRLGKPKYVGLRTPTWSDEQREAAESSARSGKAA
jgi:predicted DNA-binding transcriptional regulator AlpA